MKPSLKKPATNSDAWEREYQKPQFLTLGTEPLSDVRDFMKWLKKQIKQEGVQQENAQKNENVKSLTEWSVLDLGCGNGKNLYYVVDNFCANGIGYDISPTAIALAQKHVQESSTVFKTLAPNLRYEARSIAYRLPLADETMDLALDVTSSNSLKESERALFLGEVARILKPGGYFFTRALCKDGDQNAKNLLKEFPGKETDTYILPDIGVMERIFSREDFLATYAPFFDVVHLEKTTGYQKWGNRSYKRHYWIAYLRPLKK